MSTCVSATALPTPLIPDAPPADALPDLPAGADHRAADADIDADDSDECVRAAAAFNQRFWEAQMAILTGSRTGSGLLDLLAAAEQRAALLRLAQAGRELAAAQAR